MKDLEQEIRDLHIDLAEERLRRLQIEQRWKNANDLLRVYLVDRAEIIHQLRELGFEVDIHCKVKKIGE